VKKCGYALDDRIELDQGDLTLHQVDFGESLEMLALNYETSVQAIREINYFLPSPLWTDVVVVIPIGSTEVDGLPVLEPVLIAEPVTTLASLGEQLSASTGVLADGTLDPDCPAYAGWILVTHAARKNP
jgi:hypothetical protein